MDSIIRTVAGTRRNFLRTIGIASGAIALAACSAPAAPTPQVIEKEKIVEKVVTQIVEKDKIVEKSVDKVVTQIVEKEKVVEKQVDKVVTQIVEKQTAMKRTEIRASHWWGETFKKSLILEAARMMPELLIKEETTPWGEYHTKLLTQSAAGVAPDAFLQDSTFNGAFFTSGVELALNDYLKASALDPKKWSIPLEKETAFKGKIYGLPQFYSEQMVVSFNTEMITKEGIKLPMPGTPEFDSWNFTKLVDVLKQLTKRTSDGKVEQWGLGRNFDGFGWQHQIFMSQNGAKLFNTEDHYGETEIFINSPENTQVLQDFADLHLKHKISPTAAESQAIQGGPFMAKKAAATIYQGMACCNKDFPFGFQTIAMPWHKMPGRIFGGNHWAIGTKSKLQDEAWKWIQFTTTDRKGIQDSGFPTWHSIASYDHLYHLETLPKGDIKQAYEAWFLRKYQFEVPRWLGEKQPEKVQKTIGDEMNAVYQGKKTVPEALTAAKAQVDALIKK